MCIQCYTCTECGVLQSLLRDIHNFLLMILKTHQLMFPEEVRHAHVSANGFYREAFSGGLVANLRANGKLRLS